MNRKQWICIWLAGCLFLSPLPAFAQADFLPSDVFLVIMLKALNYDRNIDRLADGKVLIGIVYINGDGHGQDFARKIEDNFGNIQSKSQLKNLPTEIKVMGFDKNVDRKTFEEKLKQNHVSVVVVATQDPDTNKIIFEVTRGLKVDSVCYSSECVKQGAGMGIVIKDNKPRMLINLDAAKEEGSDYSAKFLTLCEVVK